MGNASWSDWENWSRCSKTCDGGNQRRTRVCNIRNSGVNCGADGSSGNETKSCNEQTCPGKNRLLDIYIYISGN